MFARINISACGLHEEWGICNICKEPMTLLVPNMIQSAGNKIVEK